MCLLERRINNRQLHDKRYGLYERAITYEGPEFHSTAAPLRGNVLPSQVQRICENVVQHVGEVSFQKHRIKLMVINFKVDAKDRVWLLWASSIRLSDDTFGGNPNSHGGGDPINIDSIVKLPATIKLNPTPSHNNTASNSAPVPFVPCVSCGKKRPSDQFHPTPYKTIIKHFEQVVTLLTADMAYASANGALEWPPDPAIITAAGGVGFGAIEGNPTNDNITLEDVTIPPVVRQLHTKLTAPAYRRYRKDPLFLYKTAMCCESCFLVYAEMASVAFQIKPVKGKNADQDQGRSRRWEGQESVGRSDESKWLPVDQTGGSSRRQNTHARDLARRSMMSSQVDLEGSMDSGFIGQPPPDFPVAIRSVAGKWDESGVQMPTGGTSSLLEKTAPVMTEEIIQKREDAFFREMLSEHKPDNTHPLSHLITAQSKLDSLTLGAPEVGVENKKDKKKKSRQNPYEQPQHFVEVTKGRRKGKGGKKKGATEEKVELEEKGPSAPAMSASAARHRNFLLSTLSDIQNQLAAPTALKTLVENTRIEERSENKNLKAVGEEEEVGDDALPEDAQGGGSLGLFKQSLKIGERMTTVTSFAHHPYEGGPYQITFVVMYQNSGESWRISVTEEDLGLEEDASLASMPLPKLKGVAKKVVEQLTWVGSEEEGDLGLVFLALG